MCLDLLCEHGAMTLAVLASHLHISSSTMVGIVDRLEKKQFVTRTRDNVDRRSVFIDVTEEGRNFIISAPHLLHNKLHDSLQKLSEIERIQIANSLDRLILLMNNK
jgi:DNA-binding MarR family transcriptional regulator